MSVGIVTVEIHIVAIADINGGAGIGRPTGDELRTHATLQRRIVETQTCENIASELIRRPRADDVVIKRHQARVMSGKSTLVEI